MTDFLLPLGDNIVTILYEVLWRFFSLFGEIDVNFIFKGFKFGYREKYGICKI